MKLFQSNNIEIVTACREFFGFELRYQVLYCPNELKNFKTVFTINLCSLYYLSPVYCIMLIF